MELEFVNHLQNGSVIFTIGEILNNVVDPHLDCIVHSVFLNERSLSRPEFSTREALMAMARGDTMVGSLHVD